MLTHTQGELTHQPVFSKEVGGGGETEPLQEAAPPISPPFSLLREAHWPFCLPTVGIVPPRTKSPTEEEVTPSGVVRRNANGLPNGLSARVSTLAGSGGLAGLSQARSPVALSVHYLSLLFEKPRAGGRRQRKAGRLAAPAEGSSSRRHAKGQGMCAQ